MLAGLNGIAVLWTMVEWHVQPLKLRAHLLCDYARIKDPSRETMEMLEAGEVTKWVTGLVTPMTIVAVGNAVQVFLDNYRPNLMSPLFLSVSFLHLGPLILLVLF